MPVRIITLEREYGSGGGEIAAQVAARLGWKLWDQLLTEEIARRLDCDCRAVEEREERRDPAFHRLLKAFMRGSFEGSLHAPRYKMVDTECVRENVQKIVREIADAGNAVIVGRGSAYYLGARHDAYHVFVYAPFEERVRRLKLRNKSEREAIELAETVDRDRAIFIKKYFQVDWPERHRFHLMVNSGVGEKTAVEIILDSFARYTQQRG
jgi:cytidylate kinase